MICVCDSQQLQQDPQGHKLFTVAPPSQWWQTPVADPFPPLPKHPHPTKSARLDSLTGSTGTVRNLEMVTMRPWLMRRRRTGVQEDPWHGWSVTLRRVISRPTAQEKCSHVMQPQVSPVTTPIISQLPVQITRSDITVSAQVRNHLFRLQDILW